MVERVTLSILGLVQNLDSGTGLDRGLDFGLDVGLMAQKAYRRPSAGPQQIKHTHMISWFKLNS